IVRTGRLPLVDRVLGPACIRYRAVSTVSGRTPSVAVSAGAGRSTPRAAADADRAGPGGDHAEQAKGGQRRPDLKLGAVPGKLLRRPGDASAAAAGRGAPGGAARRPG